MARWAGERAAPQRPGTSLLAHFEREAEPASIPPASRPAPLPLRTLTATAGRATAEGNQEPAKKHSSLADLFTRAPRAPLVEPVQAAPLRSLGEILAHAPRIVAQAEAEPVEAFDMPKPRRRLLPRLSASFMRTSAVVGLGAIVGGAAGYLMAPAPLYRSASEVMLSRSDMRSASGGTVASGADVPAETLAGVVASARSQAVLQDALARVSAPVRAEIQSAASVADAAALAKAISGNVSTAPGSAAPAVKISAFAPSPAASAELANAIADATAATRLNPPPGGVGAEVSVYASAAHASRRTWPIMEVAAGAAAGIVVTLLLASLLPQVAARLAVWRNRRPKDPGGGGKQRGPATKPRTLAALIGAQAPSSRASSPGITTSAHVSETKDQAMQPTYPAYAAQPVTAPAMQPQPAYANVPIQAHDVYQPQPAAQAQTAMPQHPQAVTYYPPQPQHHPAPPQAYWPQPQAFQQPAYPQPMHPQMPFPAAHAYPMPHGAGWPQQMFAQPAPFQPQPVIVPVIVHVPVQQPAPMVEAAPVYQQPVAPQAQQAAPKSEPRAANGRPFLVAHGAAEDPQSAIEEVRMRLRDFAAAISDLSETRHQRRAG